MPDILKAESDGIDLKTLKKGDRFYVTDKDSGGTDWIVNESLVEFVCLQKSKRSLIVKVIELSGGVPYPPISCIGEHIKVGEKQCFTRKDNRVVRFVAY